MRTTSIIKKILKQNGLRLEGFERSPYGHMIPIVMDNETNTRFTMPPKPKTETENVSGKDGFIEALNEVTEKKTINLKDYPYSVLIENLSLKSKTYNILKNEGINLIGELIAYSPDELMKIFGFGKRCLEDVNDNLKKYKVALS